VCPCPLPCPLLSHDMRNIRSQSGFFLIMIVVILMILAAIMVPAMVNLSGTSSYVATMGHEGDLAFTAAESGLKYGVYQLENNYTNNPPTQPATTSPLILTPPAILDVTPPCTVSVKVTLPNCSPGQPLLYSVQSSATCNQGSSTQSARSLVVRVSATHAGGGPGNSQCKGSYNFKMAPGSWSES
jgi:Tfp pilus assembly protein PilX